MSDNENVVSIKILDRPYNIKCSPEEAHVLQESAKYVEEQMNILRQSAAISRNVDQIAVVTALNLCRELITLKQKHTQDAEKNSQQINDIQNRIKDFLATNEEIAV